jgi:hypothetical protein
LFGKARSEWASDPLWNDPEQLRTTAELCLLIVARATHLPQFRRTLLEMAGEFSERADQLAGEGSQSRSLIQEVTGRH